MGWNSDDIIFNKIRGEFWVKCMECGQTCYQMTGNNEDNIYDYYWVCTNEECKRNCQLLSKNDVPLECKVFTSGILRDRYAGCRYNYLSSLSPIIIRYRAPVSEKEMREIVKLFPKHIRIEFQETSSLDEIVVVAGRGDLWRGQTVNVQLTGPIEITGLEKLRFQLGEKDDSSNNSS